MTAHTVDKALKRFKAMASKGGDMGIKGVMQWVEGIIYRTTGLLDYWRRFRYLLSSTWCTDQRSDTAEHCSVNTDCVVGL